MASWSLPNERCVGISYYPSPKVGVEDLKNTALNMNIYGIKSAEEVARSP